MDGVSETNTITNITKQPKKRIECADYLKFVAAFFIINSHISALYPESLAFLGFGGTFGNYLFVLMSGFLLFVPKKNFFVWYGKKIIRIYVPYILALLLFYIWGFSFSWMGLLDLLFPYKSFHFVASIMLLYLIWYPIGFFICKTKWGLPICLLAIFAIHMVYSFTLFDYASYTLGNHFNVFEMIIYLELMVVGAMLRKHCLRPLIQDKKGIIFLLACGAFAVGSFVAFTLLGKESLHPAFNILRCYVAFAFCVSLAFIAIGLDNYLPKLRFVSFVSKVTLELYLVQFAIINAVTGLIFPTRLFLCLVCVLGSAYVVNSMSSFLQSVPRIIAHRKASDNQN